MTTRTRKDILETESMLQRLTALLTQHADPMQPVRPRQDAESLRRISMTLHRWFEAECNGDFEINEDGIPGRDHGTDTFYPIPDRETGARKRLASIMKNYPALTAYVQTDPRGCALYILRPDDVPAGATIDSCYSRGLAVFQ